VTKQFIDLFKRPTSEAARGKYLSRVFGIFSEELVRIWAADPRAPYEDLGRPTLRCSPSDRGSTLDFTLRCRETGKIYVAELKCEIEYQNYKYLVLTSPQQLNHHSKPAFAALLAAASNGPSVRVYVARQEVSVDGAILIWGAATEEGRSLVMEQNGFASILTVAEIIRDLQDWQSKPYRDLLELRQQWSNDLYDTLLASPRTDASPIIPPDAAR